MSAFQDESSAAKMQRLDAVFKKAMEVSANSFNETDLDECFGDLKGQYGNVLNKLYTNLISRTDNSIHSSYQDICLRKDLEEGMKALNVPANASSKKSIKSSSSAAPQVTEEADPLRVTIAGLKRLEMDNLKESIRQMDTDVKRLNEVAVRLRAQISTEMNAVSEEGQKLSTNGISSSNQVHATT